MAERANGYVSHILQGSPESIIFGTRLLGSLTESFARMAFGPGFVRTNEAVVITGGNVARIGLWLMLTVCRFVCTNVGCSLTDPRRPTPRK